ncbi:Homoserine/homoserine lactone efflux protein [Pseudomonas aeruginosa]|uniref:LysE family translocator n=1 Tax=Pseudomonas aeruginosa TaxID=287 RepID=UPI0022BA3250|nr:LysE family translocator [Pseudomonas aeruginosa]WBH38499.1 Homoserine/homoserine lactone efflux protein [Pseudomonas aeruginosa]
MDASAFLIALAVVYLVPGPDMLLLFQTGARQGRRAALVTALGLALARACHVLMAATGLALLFRTAPWTFDLVRLLGAAYLAWLGLQMLRGGGLALPTSDAGSAPVVPHADRRALLRGLLTNLLNPKALLFCSVLLPQFVSPEAGSLAVQFAALGTVLVLVGLAFDCAYALAGGRLGRWLASRPRAQRLQQWGFGGLLIGFGVRLALLRQL